MEATSIEKRKISELITLYTLEPELNDIYVEGPSDKCLLNRFLNNNNGIVNIIEINDIDFSELYKNLPNLKSNCKNKIIELSNQLESNFSNSLSQVMCIVDRDFDDFLSRIIINSYLHYTDFSSIELYFFNQNSFNIFFKDILHGFPFNSEHIIAQLKPVLNDIFNVKLALLNVFGCDFETNDYDFKKLIIIDKTNGTISFDPKDYIYRFLNTKKLMSFKNSVEEHFFKLTESSTPTLDLKVRGHDFIYLFYTYIDKIKNHIKINLDTIERVVFICIDLNCIAETNLFQTIRQKYVSP